MPAQPPDAQSAHDPNPYVDLVVLTRDGAPETGDAPAWQQLGAALRAVLESAGCDRVTTDAILAHAAIAPYGNHAEGRRLATYDITVATHRMSGYRRGEIFAKATPDRLDELMATALHRKTESLARLTGIIAERTAIERAIAEQKAVIA